MTTHVVVELDNLTVRADDVPWKQLLAIGIVQNDFLEQNRTVLAEHLSNMLIYGQSAIMIDDELKCRLVA